MSSESGGLADYLFRASRRDGAASHATSSSTADSGHSFSSGDNTASSAVADSSPAGDAASSPVNADAQSPPQSSNTPSVGPGTPTGTQAPSQSDATAPRVSGLGVPAGLAARTGNGVAASGARVERESEQSSGESSEESGTPPGDSSADSSGSGSSASRKSETADSDGGQELEELLSRVEQLVPDRRTEFVPKEPRSIAATGLTAEEIEKLILKLLNARGSMSGRQISAHLCLPFSLVEQVVKQLRAEMLVSLKGAAEAGDYEFILTDSGRSRAAEYSRDSSYFGAAPVCLADYLRAMAKQSIAEQEVTDVDLKRAFDDLIINPKMLDRLGPAINSGRGMFLFGEAGNGKTSIAERITACFSSSIWIPRSLGIDGEIVRLFDPGVHKVIEEPPSEGLIDLSEIDRRWVQIERPTVVVGGELTMQDLEVVQNPATRICEAPVQLKSNCGTLVIDDFGRQRMPVDELLNRWIVPLEKRYDFLNLPSGKKIQVPFDQLIVFSTNLEPNDLVDGAFLRRIPYKIQVPDPSAEEFHAIFERLAPMMGFEYKRDAVQYLVETHFENAGRPLRSCHPRDLLLQVRNYCTYRRLPRKMTDDAFDFAADNYFSIL